MTQQDLIVSLYPDLDKTNVVTDVLETNNDYQRYQESTIINTTKCSPFSKFILSILSLMFIANIITLITKWIISENNIVDFLMDTEKCNMSHIFLYIQSFLILSDIVMINILMDEENLKKLQMYKNICFTFLIQNIFRMSLFPLLSKFLHCPDVYFDLSIDILSSINVSYTLLTTIALLPALLILIVDNCKNK